MIGSDNNIIYYAEYYNDKAKTLSKVTILVFDDNHLFSRRVEAEKAEWGQRRLEVFQYPAFYWDSSREYVTEEFLSEYRDPLLNQRPETFRVTVRNVEEMQRQEAADWIASLRKAGLPFRGALTEYYKRFSFALTPFIVAIISCAIGGRLKKKHSADESSPESRYFGRLLRYADGPDTFRPDWIHTAPCRSMGNISDISVHQFLDFQTSEDMMSLTFTPTDGDEKSSARNGILELPHGKVDTPCFMPVGTLGSVKAVHPQELENMDYRIILSNTYHLYMRPGVPVIRDAGGLHPFTGWERNILTDSGGFQVFSLTSLKKIKGDGC